MLRELLCIVQVKQIESGLALIHSGFHSIQGWLRLLRLRLLLLNLELLTLGLLTLDPLALTVTLTLTLLILLELLVLLCHPLTVLFLPHLWQVGLNERVSRTQLSKGKTRYLPFEVLFFLDFFSLFRIDVLFFHQVCMVASGILKCFAASL